MRGGPPRLRRTDKRVPYTTLVRSDDGRNAGDDQIAELLARRAGVLPRVENAGADRADEEDRRRPFGRAGKAEEHARAEIGRQPPMPRDVYRREIGRAHV